MSSPCVPKHIPATTHPFFQEYNVDLLDIAQHATLIIERILGYGNRAEVHWLLETYGREQVVDWIRRSGMSKLSQRRYHLWCFVFDLPEKKRSVRVWPH